MCGKEVSAVMAAYDDSNKVTRRVSHVLIAWRCIVATTGHRRAGRRVVVRTVEGMRVDLPDKAVTGDGRRIVVIQVR